MEDKRQAMPAGTILELSADSQGYRYTIDRESGRGASCIVYLGHYENNLGEKKTVYIKECYPYASGVTRGADGELICAEPDVFDVFEACKQRFRDSFSVCNRLFESDGLTNRTANFMDIYEKNGTLYTVITYRQGQELTLPDADGAEIRPLKESISIVKSVAKTLQKLHGNGYLYLDTKPDNVFILDDMNGSIQLFDFDSVIPVSADGDMSRYRISYTNGFAAMEQRQGRLDQIGTHTDVYGVGALLFYMVFGRIPSAPDSDPFARYDFTDSLYDPFMYRDRLFMCMSAFFRNTLAVSVADRYSDMEPVIDDLTKMESDADLSKPFIHDSYYPVRFDIIGRESEIGLIGDFIDSDTGCLFVNGMGGIGKSTLVRACLDENRDEIDTVIYLYFEGSLAETFADDRKLTINTVAKLPEESIGEYFNRKLATVKRIAADQRVVLVIDDFEGDPGEDFSALRDIGCKLIVISREDIEVEDEQSVHINAVKEGEWLHLFERYLGRSIFDEEKADVKKLLELIEGHTLVTEIIAKQVRTGALSVGKAVRITEESGFSSATDKKVAFSRDGVHTHDKLLGIITGIFKADRLDDLSRSAIQTISLFDQPGVRRNLLRELAGDLYINAVAEMVRCGWIAETDGVVSIHPVIKEAIRGWAWREQSLCDQRQIMKRMAICPGNTEYQRSIIKNAVSLDKVRMSREYYALLWKWTENAARDEEKLICMISSLAEEACRYSDPVAMLRGFDFVCFVLEETERFDEAARVLAVLKEYVYGSKVLREYIIALYEAISSQFFDGVLNGNYDPKTGYERRLWSDMDGATDRAVSFMKKAVDKGEGLDSELLLITYLLDHYVFIIRGYEEFGGDPDRIWNALKRLKRMLHEASDKYSGGEYQNLLDMSRVHYLLAAAWYHTMVAHDGNAVKRMLERIHAVPSPWKTELDHIDFEIVPCAEMLCRTGFGKEAEEMLLSGIAICDDFEDVVPYQRKRGELREYLKIVRES